MIKKRYKKFGWCFSIQGFSGSGKTSIAKNILKDIEKLFGKTVRLDGDNLRSFLKTAGYSKGYSKLERGKYNYPICQLINLFLNENINIIYAWIGLNYEGNRILNKKIKNVINILIKTNIEDAKKNKEKEHIYRLKKNIVGIDISPDFPKNANIVIKNDFKIPIKTLSNELMRKLKKLNL